jgi:hypothetical protein
MHLDKPGHCVGLVRRQLDVQAPGAVFGNELCCAWGREGGGN